MNIPLLSILCLYAGIGGLLLWMFHKWKPGLLVVLVAMSCWSVTGMFLHLSEQHQRKMVVYNISGHTAVDVVNGHRVSGIAGEELADSLYDRYLRPARALYGANDEGVSACAEGYIFPGFRVLVVGNKRLVVVDSIVPEMCPEKKLRTDYLLLSHNPRVDIRRLEQIFDADYYIFDASNSLRNIQRWKSDCYVLTLRFFSVPDQGAYVVNF